jgi:hypothetical protein
VKDSLRLLPAGFYSLDPWCSTHVFADCCRGLDDEIPIVLCFIVLRENKQIQTARVFVVPAIPCQPPPAAFPCTTRRIYVATVRAQSCKNPTLEQLFLVGAKWALRYVQP